ncbi:MAG: putative transporter ATP-binding protein YheS, partial [Pseudomonadota bacterium]
DLATREALSMALNEFEGTVMLVSHDRALLRAVCDEFWLVGRGEIKPFDGDLDDYQRYLLEESKRLREEAKVEEAKVVSEVAKPTISMAVTPEKKPVAQTSEQRKLESAKRQEINARTKPFKKQIEQAEKSMAQLQAEKGQLESKLLEPVSPQEIADIGKKLKVINDELMTIEENWLGWTSEIEAIETEASKI